MPLTASPVPYAVPLASPIADLSLDNDQPHVTQPPARSDSPSPKPAARSSASFMPGWVANLIRVAIGEPVIAANAQPLAEPLGEKKFLALGESLLEAFKYHVPDSQEVARLRDLSAQLDSELMACAQQQEVSSKITDLRAQWRRCFASLLKAANSQFLQTTEPVPGFPGVAMSPAPEIGRIYAEGGGAKGQAMLGALCLLQIAGKFGYFKGGVSGTSVGSIFASLLSVDGDFEEISEVQLTEDIAEKIFAHPDVADAAMAIYKDPNGLGLQVSTNALYLDNDALGLITYMDQCLRSLTVKTLGKMQQAAAPDEAGHIASLTDRFLHSVTGLTFGELGLLVKAYPDYFKPLSIPAFDVTTRESIHFNTEEKRFADIPISVAVRASSGLSPIFKRLQINVDGQRLTLTDGGAKHKVPLESFVKYRTPDEGHDSAVTQADRRDFSDALIFMFARHGASSKVLHAPLAEAYKNNMVTSFVGAFSGDMFGIAKHRKKETDTLQDFGTSVAIIGHGDLETRDFGATACRRLVAQMEGEFDMASFLINRIGQAIRHDVTDGL